MLSLLQPTGGLKGQVCSLAYKPATTWCWEKFTLMTWVISCTWSCALNYSTTNIIMVLLINIVIYYIEW